MLLVALLGCLRLLTEAHLSMSDINGSASPDLQHMDVWTSNRAKSIAFNSKVCSLGFGASWRQDDLRMAVGSALAASGASIVHLQIYSDPESFFPLSHRIQCLLSGLHSRGFVVSTCISKYSSFSSFWFSVSSSVHESFCMPFCARFHFHWSKV